MMNGGHYISFVKSELTNSWLQYDDSSVKDIPESKIRTEFAYLLFYKRKDLIDTKLSEIYPSIGKQSLFKGKPIKIKIREKS